MMFPSLCALSVGVYPNTVEHTARRRRETPADVVTEEEYKLWLIGRVREETLKNIEEVLEEIMPEQVPFEAVRNLKMDILKMTSLLDRLGEISGQIRKLKNDKDTLIKTVDENITNLRDLAMNLFVSNSETDWYVPKRP